LTKRLVERALSAERAVQLPGHLVQVHVTSATRVHVGRPMPGSEVAFLTIYRNPSTPEHVAGLNHGAQLRTAATATPTATETRVPSMRPPLSRTRTPQ